MKGKLIEDKVIVSGEEAKEVFNTGWYGNLKKKKLELDLVEALLLVERERLEVFQKNKKMKFEDFYHFCCSKKGFEYKYIVYKDLRDRGLPVRIGFKGSDFRVYERGAKPGKEGKIKWIVFTIAEDYPCKIDELGNAIKLSKNIRTTTLWAVVDNDFDVTYYILQSPEKL